jgi:hypothetical protein
MFSSTRDHVSIRDSFNLPPALRDVPTESASASASTSASASALPARTDTDANADAYADAYADDAGIKSDKHSKRSSVPTGTFTTREIRSTPTPVGGGGKRGSAARSMKRVSRNKRSARSRSVKFIMPSRKKLLTKQHATAHVGSVVNTMQSNTLTEMLVTNKLIKLNSKAPVGLMRNIATGVFAP